MDVVTEFPNEVEYIFRPSCVALQRCGGCCGDEGLRCVPVETSTVTLQVSAAAAGLWPHQGGGGLLANHWEGELATSHPPDILAAWIIAGRGFTRNCTNVCQTRRVPLLLFGLVPKAR